MERIIANLSRLFASFVMCSENWTPGTAVGMALNSPRYSTGASGLGSNVSKCVGPPSIQMRMHDLAFAAGLLTASAANPRARNAVSNPPPVAAESELKRVAAGETVTVGGHEEPRSQDCFG